MERVIRSIFSCGVWQASLFVSWISGVFADDPERSVPGSILEITEQFRLGTETALPCSNVPTGLSSQRLAYPEFEAVEWQWRLSGGQAGAGVLYQDLKSADFVVRFPAADLVTLHGSEGSHGRPTDFRPWHQQLAVDQPYVYESFGGRSSDGVMPYFNLATHGGGLIVAVGWAGDWRASFTAGPGGVVRVEAGLKRSRFRWQGEESLQLPSILVLAYRGDWLHGQNQLRRLMRRYFTPTGHVEADLMPIAASVHGMIGFNDTNESNLLEFANQLAELRLPLDTFWLDAGWNQGGFPGMQGNPQADPERFPRGLAPIGEAARRNGWRFLAWFEPERVMRGTWLQVNHPDWLLQPSDLPVSLQYQKEDGFYLLDLGNPHARQWAVEAVSEHILAAGVAIYRHDFNLYPSYFWHTDESANDVGLREIRYINGLYRFLDELRQRHPGMIIDNCAAGGRRLDFEMMRRTVVLWRSDSTWGEAAFPRNVQAMTLGLSHWLPLHGLGANAADTISLRSGIGVCASFAVNYRDPACVAALRQHLELYLPVRHLIAADFYPLTPWSERPTDWLAFQFHDPSEDSGLVQAFRGPVDESGPVRLVLRGLAPQQQYKFTDWDTPTNPRWWTADEHGGLVVELNPSGPEAQALVLVYHSRDSNPAP